MRTIKSIPTLMLAASLGAGMILVSETAFARNNNHSGNNGHQEHNGMRSDHNGMRSGSGDRAGAREGKRLGEKKDKGKVKQTDSGSGSSTGGWKVTHGGKPPRAPVITKKPPTSADGGKPPKGPVTTEKPPAKGAPVAGAGLPGGTAVVSNGRVKLYIPNSASGLTVTKNASGTITVSNGDPTRSVTLPGGSLTISGGGVTSVGGAAGVQVIRHPNGDFAAAASLPPAAPSKPTPPTPGKVTGGPEGGFVHALGSGVKEIFNPEFERKVPGGK